MVDKAKLSVLLRWKMKGENRRKNSPRILGEVAG
jgi:hypothetical protein